MRSLRLLEVCSGVHDPVSPWISKLGADIESRQREIGTLRVQVSEGQKEIQRLQKVRGSEQTLLKNLKDAAEGEQS